MHHDQVISGETLDDVVNHPLTAEEDRPLVLLERPETHVGPGRQGRSDHVGLLPPVEDFIEPTLEIAQPLRVGSVDDLDPELIGPSALFAD
jgi:hypothetical protein